MKGKKLAFALILSLIVCLMLIPTSAWAEEAPTEGEIPVETELPVEPETSEEVEEEAEAHPGFQVELTYGENVYTMDGLRGGDVFDLEEIVKALGIEGAIDAAAGDADELFTVEAGESGWTFTTKSAFDTEQKLVLTVNGEEYVILVTDMNDPAKVTTEEELQKAINEAYSGQTIIVDADIDVANGITIGSDKKVTIDLNGKTLKVKDGGRGVYLITNSGDLTVEDSSEAETGTLYVQGDWSRGIVNNGTAELNGGTFTNKAGDGSRIISNRNEMTINDGFKLEGNGTWAYIDNYNDWSGDNVPNPILTVNGGDFSAVSGKTIIKNDVRGTVVINDGKFDGCFLQNSGVKATINGGEFSRTNGNALFGVYGDASGANCNGETIINGGTFNSNGNIVARWDDKQLGGSLTITGGTFNGTLQINEKIPMTINGGDYSTDVVESFRDETGPKTTGSIEDFLGAGYEVVEKDNRFYVVPSENADGTDSVSDDLFGKYWVVEGRDQTWTKGSADGLKFTLNVHGGNVTNIYIDGEVVDFEVDENGDIVISAEVFEALEAGEHEVVFGFVDGSCMTNFTVAA